ncbi:CRISPR-associated protein Csx3 [Nostocales cyanobacterium HT-58-2]|nr:CRISPR-associated protein Csx3 [Nostocales cyanobacterium HT-58-2]
MNPSHPSIRLHLSHHENPQGLKYQQLTIELTRKDRIIYPEEIADLELPSGIDTTCGVVISGRAPIWLHGYLMYELHPTAWVAYYEPRMYSAIVAATQTRQVKIGQVIPLEQKGDGTLCAGLMIVGPPDSGKSVLSHTLFKALLADHPDIYLQRANWDGEGNYVLESVFTEEQQEAFKAANKGGLTERFFPYHAQAILQLRRQKALVIVDVGGMVQPEKQPILEACSHYIIISSKPEAIPAWHEFCRDSGNLKPVAVIHSTLSECEIIHQQEPYVEITCGPWVRGQATEVPVSLLECVRPIVKHLVAEG